MMICIEGTACRQCCFCPKPSHTLQQSHLTPYPKQRSRERIRNNYQSRIRGNNHTMRNTLVVLALLQALPATAASLAEQGRNAIRQQVLAATRERGWQEVNVDVTLLNPPAEVTSRRCRSVEINAIPTDNLIRRSVRIDCHDDTPFSVTIAARLQVSAKVVSLANDVAPGTPLNASDLTLIDKPVGTLETDTVMRSEDALGIASRRRMKQGQVLLRRQLDLPWKITRGSTVTLVIREEGVEISVETTAQDNGREGDWIKVMKTGSRKVLRARVNADGTVTPAESAQG